MHILLGRPMRTTPDCAGFRVCASAYFFVFVLVAAFIFLLTFEDFPVDCKELVEPGGSSVYQVGLCTLELGRHERSFRTIYNFISCLPKLGLGNSEAK